MSDLLIQALILDMMEEKGLIDQDTIHDTLDQMVQDKRDQNNQNETNKVAQLKSLHDNIKTYR